MIRHRLIPRITPRQVLAWRQLPPHTAGNIRPDRPGTAPGLRLDHGSRGVHPDSFAANDADVLTVVWFRGRSRSTGKTAEMNLHHYFRFGDSKTAYYRGTEDTAQTQTVQQD
jgi:hypothetical protein